MIFTTIKGVVARAVTRFQVPPNAPRIAAIHSTPAVINQAKKEQDPENSEQGSTPSENGKYEPSQGTLGQQPNTSIKKQLSEDAVRRMSYFLGAANNKSR